MRGMCAIIFFIGLFDIFWLFMEFWQVLKFRNFERKMVKDLPGDLCLEGLYVWFFLLCDRRRSGAFAF